MSPFETEHNVFNQYIWNSEVINYVSMKVLIRGGGVQNYDSWLTYNSGRTEERSPPFTFRVLLRVIRFRENRCLVMDYFAAILCSGNMLTEPLPRNDHIRHSIMDSQN
jgi:hypothetical protein